MPAKEHDCITGFWQ